MLNTPRRARAEAIGMFHEPTIKDYVVPPPKTEDFPAPKLEPKDFQTPEEYRAAEEAAQKKTVEDIKAAIKEWEKFERVSNESPLRYHKEAFERSHKEYKEKLENVKLIFRPVLEDEYMDWPYDLNQLEMDEELRLERLRLEQASNPKHPCHQKGWHTSEYLKADAKLTRKILRPCLIGCEGFKRFDSGVFVIVGEDKKTIKAEEYTGRETLDEEQIDELIESIIRGKMMLLAVTCAFKSQGLTVEETLY